MPSTESHWPDYYQAIDGRPPRPLLLAALSLFPAGGNGHLAIDLGCGDGTDTLLLLAQGWRVLAVDNEEQAIDLLRSRVPAADRPRLETRLAPFSEAALPPADLVFAGYSLPFCPPDDFAPLWASLGGVLRPGGVLAAHLFGVRDGYAGEKGMNFHTVEAIPALLAGWIVAHLREIEHTAPSSVGPKHWHVFEIIARRPGPADS